MLVQFCAHGHLQESFFVWTCNILFVQGVIPSVWNSLGMGYVGTLIILWILFPFYVCRINSLKQSTIMAVCTSVAVVSGYKVFMFLNPVLGNAWGPCINYFIRGVHSYCIGNVLFYLKDIKNTVKNNRSSLLVIFSCLYFCICIFTGEEIDHFIFDLICLVLCWIGIEGEFTILLIRPLQFLGIHIFEIFILHTTILYVCVSYIPLFYKPYMIFYGILTLSLVLVPFCRKYITITTATYTKKYVYQIGRKKNIENEKS